MEVTCGCSVLPVDAGNVEDGGREVDVEDGLGAPRAGREAGAAHEERHFDVELDKGENSVSANRDTTSQNELWSRFGKLFFCEFP